MVDSFTNGKLRLVQPSFGSYPNQWQLPVNSDWGTIDAGLSGTTTLNTSSLTPSTPFWTLVFQEFPVSPTPWQNPLAGQNMRILVTGALTYNATVFIPQNFPGIWIIDNQTTGAFTLTVKTTNPSSSGVTVNQSKSLIVFCDGINVSGADTGNNFTVPVATDTVPGIVTQGFLPGNCVNLNSEGKIPFATDKVIISTSTPDPNQGQQNWVWYQVV